MTIEVEPNAIETYQNTTTLLLSYKLALKRDPMRKVTSGKAKTWNKGQKERIAERIQHTANMLSSETKDPVLYDTLRAIVKEKQKVKVYDTLELTFNTMKRDGML